MYIFYNYKYVIGVFVGKVVRFDNVYLLLSVLL